MATSWIRSTPSVLDVRGMQALHLGGPAEPDDGADPAQAPDARHATPITGAAPVVGLWVSIVALCGFVLVGAIAIKLTRAPSGAPPAEPQPSEDPAVMQLIASVTEAEQKANEAMQLHKRHKGRCGRRAIGQTAPSQ